MSSVPTYEPLSEAPLLPEEGAKTRKSRTSRKKRSSSSSSKAGLVLVVLAVLVIGVVLAITLPLVLKKPHPASVSSRSAPSNNRAASLDAGPATTMPAAVAASVAATASNLGPIPPAGQLAGGPLAGNAIDVLARGAAPNLNIGDIYCYTRQMGPLGSAAQHVLPISSLRFMEGSFRKTGAVEKVDGIIRAQVESCGSGALFYLRNDRLEKCDAVCQTPQWKAVDEGTMQEPLYAQENVCQGTNIYVNTKTTRNTFYLKYASFVMETLVTGCDNNQGYYVPVRELRLCTDKEVNMCEQRNSVRTVPTGPVVLIEGSLPETPVERGPLCLRKGGDPLFSTGITRNKFVFSSLKNIIQVQVTRCDGTPAEVPWVLTTDVVACSTADVATCKQMKAMQGVPTEDPALNVHALMATIQGSTAKPTVAAAHIDDVADSDLA